MALAETTETTAHGGHKDGEFPPFNTSTYPGQLVWLAITFGFLYWAMARKVVPRLAAILDVRRDTIAADLAAASRERTEAEAAGRAYEASLGAARANAQSIAQETRSKLNAESESRRKGLEGELAARMAAAEAAIASRTRDAMTNVRGIASDAAGAIVERLTGRAPDPSAVAAALDRLPGS